MQSVAQGWLVFRLTDSAFALGVVGFCSFAPVLFLALPAGVVADRVPRRAALAWTQSAAMALALALAALTLSGLIRPWHVAALAFGLGTVQAIDMPLRQSLLHDLVGRDDLPNAIALNSLAFNGARFLGPVLAGLLLVRWGEGWVFLLNGLSFAAVLLAVARMDAPGRRPRTGSGWWAEMRQGLEHAAREPRMRVMLILVVVSSVFAMPYSILLPVFARDVLGVGPGGLGMMTGATGLGAMTAAFGLAAWRGRLRAGRIVAAALALAGASLIGFSLSRLVWLSLGLLFVTGGAMLTQMATSNTMLQLMSPPELRGRIIGLYTLAFVGMAPLGSLLAGSLAAGVGTRQTVGLGGIACLVAAAWLVTRLPGLRAAAEAVPLREKPASRGGPVAGVTDETGAPGRGPVAPETSVPGG